MKPDSVLPLRWVVTALLLPISGSSLSANIPKRHGLLHVGEIYEGSTFTGVYQMDGDKVSVN